MNPHDSTAAQPRFFFCRLIPPRPTFAADMTPDEASIMQSHVAYWSDLLARGKAVVFGPVADPHGPWGLGVIRVADEAEASALTEGDPAGARLSLRGAADAHRGRCSGGGRRPAVIAYPCDAAPFAASFTPGARRRGRRISASVRAPGAAAEPVHLRTVAASSGLIRGNGVAAAPGLVGVSRHCGDRSGGNGDEGEDHHQAAHVLSPGFVQAIASATGSRSP